MFHNHLLLLLGWTESGEGLCCIGNSRVLGERKIKSHGLLGTCPGPIFGPHKLCDLRQDSSLSESWFSPLQNKDINFLPSNYPIGLLWEII